jgi:hypothetical protein
VTPKAAALVFVQQHCCCSFFRITVFFQQLWPSAALGFSAVFQTQTQQHRQRSAAAAAADGLQGFGASPVNKLTIYTRVANCISLAFVRILLTFKHFEVRLFILF